MATEEVSKMEAKEIQDLVAALNTTQLQSERKQKLEAHHFLEAFQKSHNAWQTSHEILGKPSLPAQVRLFAATTLKGKIIYDLDQIPRSSLIPLRDSILTLLIEYKGGLRPIRTQLCLCLVNLAIQMLEWSDVISLVGQRLGPDCISTTVEFLTLLPEEVLEGRKINLSEEELSLRSKELLETKSKEVLELLNSLSDSQVVTTSVPTSLLLACVTSWLREIPVADIVHSPLFERCIIHSLSSDEFEAAVDCLCTIIHDTRDVDESAGVIQILYQQLMNLRPRIEEAANSDDQTMMHGLTRLFAEAGERWVVLVARLPKDFQGLVNAILECCARDKEYEAVSQTFLFWFELKQMLVLPKYLPARQEYATTFSELVEVLINRLRFPCYSGEETVSDDPFDGDREQEEKFRETRHHIGDVLKDCCEVISPSECLAKTLIHIQQWLNLKGSETRTEMTRDWQSLESALFAMRAMGRMISPEENVTLPIAIPLIIQLPQHEKITFQVLMAVGRYTEWTSQHPEFLKLQLDFVMAQFKSESREVVKASALAFRFFGLDCRHLLSDHIGSLHVFYESVLDSLAPASQEEITEGVAAVVAQQSPHLVFASMKMFCDPLMNRIMSLANTAKTSADENASLAVADRLQLVTIFIQQVQPVVDPKLENPAVAYCQEILPVLFAVAENFTGCIPVLERVCRCWRSMVLSYRAAILPILPALATQLATGFETSRQGCFLWATDSVIREFASGEEHVTSSTAQSVWIFFERQATAFLRILNDTPAGDLPDLVEDFYRLLIDALIYYHETLLSAPICCHLISASISVLTLESQPPLTAVMHFLLDFCSYGTDHPNSSRLCGEESREESRQRLYMASRSEVQSILNDQGELLLRRLLVGMMFSFPPDCITMSSAIIMTIFKFMPRQVAGWLRTSIEAMPQDYLRSTDAQKLLDNIDACVQAGEARKLRTIMQDFTSMFRRRHVAPRDGLTLHTGPSFQFSG